ncbi:MAG TPA: hypothetical protein DIW48_06695 [Sphaerochaeta sp.]|nr:hypothetical protein [Sphaerochaeta sp.]
MKKMTWLSMVAIVLMVAFVAIGCSKPAPVAQAPAAAPAAAAPAAPAAPVSDGSQDLKISYRLNTAAPDAENYFSFAGNIRYMVAEKDHADATTGASALGSTHLFNAYLYDVEGKATLSSGLRGMFLFGVTPYSQIEGDNFVASKAADGTITIQYTHRGTAYRIITDKSGKLLFPNGTFEMRNVGYIVGGGPQVISKDFSADGTAATVDYAKVWDSSVAGGKLVDDKSDKKTGNIVKNIAAADAQYFFDGALQVALENNILTVNGALTAVQR